MAREDIDRVRAGYDAFNRRDLDGILALLADEIEYRMPLDPLGVHPVFRGHAGVTQFYETVWDGFEEFLVEVESVRELPGDVLVLGGHVVARPRGGRETTSFRISHFWKLVDGKAVAVAFHDAINPLALLDTGPQASATEEGGSLQ
jgi:ketosteroid isomerase-like protein